MLAQPYLFFNGRTEEAMEFYKKALDAKPNLVSRFGDNPGPPMGPNVRPEKIMHAELHIGKTVVLVSDGQCGGSTDFKGFSISVTADSVERAETAFAALADGGNVSMPLAQTFFAKRFGQVTDRFGLQWMIVFGA